MNNEPIYFLLHFHTNIFILYDILHDTFCIILTRLCQKHNRSLIEKCQDIMLHIYYIKFMDVHKNEIGIIHLWYFKNSNLILSYRLFRYKNVKHEIFMKFLAMECHRQFSIFLIINHLLNVSFPRFA